MNNTSQHGYRVAIFIQDANQYLFLNKDNKDGNPFFSANRMSARRVDSIDAAHDMGSVLADAYETTYIIEPWYETGRDSA